ncbi:MAG: hypothetical protein OEX10_01685 [Candidatus Bathyarchaeota archaeon]|nr:hypothetical protein [Candidatus Bathyarchaeota archaeon]
MSAEPLTSIKDADFIFKNTPVKIVVNRNCPEIKLAGLKVGPYQEGKEYEVKFWIAQELKRAGIARFREEELLDLMKLNKIHWKERVQASQQVAALPEDFYPRLRRYLADLKSGAIKKPETMRDYEKARRLSRDIINLRLKKIVSLASSPAQTNQILGNLTREERVVYERLYGIISEWRAEILKIKGGGES